MTRLNLFSHPTKNVFSSLSTLQIFKARYPRLFAQRHKLGQERYPSDINEGDIILTKLATARNSLIPKKIAYYVPRVRGKAVLPTGWVPAVKQSTETMEVIVPAIQEQEYIPLKEAKEAVKKLTSAQIKEKLASIPVLSFERMRISEDSRAIFGSVSTEDIALLLSDKYSIALPKDAINNIRIKELGMSRVTVDLSGLPPVEILVEVKAPQEVAEGVST